MKRYISYIEPFVHFMTAPTLSDQVELCRNWTFPVIDGEGIFYAPTNLAIYVFKERAVGVQLV